MIKNVLLAVDSFENSSNALNFMQRMTGCIGNVVVLTVIDNTFALSRTGLKKDSDEWNEYPAAQHEEAIAQKQLQEVTNALKNMGFQAKGLLVAGTPINTIPKQLEKYDCDLLIISHRHLSSLGRWLNTSVTRSLLDDIAQPVLVIPL
ncbi:universal stress protein [Providencia sp. Me31A]|uniref:universal stress protein n=1 Tax=Providencia sp. Me31A TaxID=3392637 RepID=UPI003D294B46